MVYMSDATRKRGSKWVQNMKKHIGQRPTVPNNIKKQVVDLSFHGCKMPYISEKTGLSVSVIRGILQRERKDKQ